MYPESILFVCTGNTCRSIMAERIAKKIFELEKLPIKVNSAGTHARGEDASTFTYQLMRENDLDSSPHKPKGLDSIKEIKDYALVLVMERMHKEYIKDVFKREENVYILTEYVGEEGEILDPFGKGIEEYRECFRKIEESIEKMVKVWKTIALGADHAGWKAKEEAKEIIEKLGFFYNDFGTFTPESCDYPEYAFAVANSVRERKVGAGMLFCRTGIGMSICANKVPGIRAALCLSKETARLARQHNDANILVIGASFLKDPLEEIIKGFLFSRFDGGRHKKRLDKLKEIESIFL